jgi:hypothetical protein
MHFHIYTLHSPSTHPHGAGGITELAVKPNPSFCPETSSSTVQQKKPHVKISICSSYVWEQQVQLSLTKILEQE